MQDKKITKGIAAAQAITKGKIEKTIILSKSKEIIGGDFPVYHTGTGEIVAGKFGKMSPKYVRAGRVVKEMQVTKDILYKGKPTAVTLEKYAFREKGVSAREMESWYASGKKPFYLTEEMFKRMEAQRLLREQKVRGNIFGIGGLVPPVEVTKPLPKGKPKPAGVITDQFLAGARIAARTEWLKGIQRSKVLTIATLPKQKPSIAIFTRPYIDVSERMGVVTALKPKVSAKEYIDERIRLVSAVKPTVKAAEDVIQRPAIVSALRPSIMVEQQVAQKPVTKQVAKTITKPFHIPIPIPIPIPQKPFIQPFIFSFPTQKKEEKKRKKKLLPFGRKYSWSPSLSWVLGGQGQAPSPSQAVGKLYISPMMLRGRRKKRRKKRR